MNEEEFLNQNKEKITSGNAKKVFSKVLKKAIEVDNLQVFYDFLGEILLAKPSLLEGNNYLKILKSYDDLIFKTLTLKMKSNSKIELEKYFLEKYCIMESEEILLYFFGVVKYKGKMYNTRVFITNYRIIVLSSDNTVKSGFIAGAGLLFNLSTIIENKIVEIMRKNLAREMQDRLEIKPTLFFGYNFPLINPSAIQLKKYEKGKYKGKLESLTFTSSIEDQLYNYEIICTNEELYPKLISILENLQE